MKCSYKYKKDCKHIDTAGMTKTKECINCDWYDNAIVESRGTPVLDWFLALFKWVGKLSLTKIINTVFYG